jgi:ubiquinone/menaquinone biosynthesis C-methylase UbiE
MAMLSEHLMESAFCRPRGVVGWFGGGFMSLDRHLPAWVVELLEIEPSDSVLEVGPGPGVGLALAAAKAHQGWVAGVDPSPTMLAMAERRNHAQIEAGRIALRLGTADNLPFDDATFDKAMTMNSLHLWPNPVVGLREVRRTLRPGSRIAVAITRYSNASPDRFEQLLIASGFTNVIVQRGNVGTCATGHA